MSKSTDIADRVLYKLAQDKERSSLPSAFAALSGGALLGGAAGVGLHALTQKSPLEKTLLQKVTNYDIPELLRKPRTWRSAGGLGALAGTGLASGALLYKHLLRKENSNRSQY